MALGTIAASCITAVGSNYYCYSSSINIQRLNEVSSHPATSEIGFRIQNAWHLECIQAGAKLLIESTLR